MKTKDTVLKMFCRRTERNKRKGSGEIPYHLFGLSLAIVLLFAGICVASANTYYMSPSGDNDNDGTSLDSAWATLSHAQNQLNVGDTLLIVDGIYYNDVFVAQVSGTADNPINIKAYNGTPTFIESESVRTLALFECHYFGQPGPISYYNIDGIRAENYKFVFSPWRESHNLTFSNIETKNCHFSVRLHRGCYNIVMKNFTVENSYYAPFHFWYYNHHCTLENATVTGTIYDHGLIDFHTDTDNFTIRDVSFHGRMPAGEAIYLHGDYGTNDNNVFQNITLNITEDTGGEAMDIWSVGYNNYFENMTIIDAGHGWTGSAAIRLMGEGANLIMKDIKIINPGIHGFEFSSFSDVDGMMFDNVSIEGVDYASWYSDYSGSFFNTANITIRNPSGDDNDIKISPQGQPGGYFVVEFTDGKVFSPNSRYYPDKSNYSVEGGVMITYYPLTAVPESDSATITVNKYDTSLPQGEILVEFTADTTNENNVAFTAGDLDQGKNYITKKDAVNLATERHSPGHIKFSNSEWPAARTFTVEETNEVDITPPTTNGTGWNDVTPVVVTFFRSDNGSGISHTNYSKTSESGPWTTVNINAATGPDAGNVADVSESGFNVAVWDEGDTTIWYYSVDNNFNVEAAKSVTVKIDATATGTISGIVTNTTNNAPIQGATVTVEGTEKSGETDANGVYTITDVPINTYTVTCTAPDYQDSYKPDIAVNESETTTVIFALISSTITPLEDLVGEWRFEEGTEGIAADSSGNGNNGTIHGNAMRTAGKLGSSLSFDGEEDYIEIPAAQSLNSITSKITIEAWIKTDFAQRGTIVDNWFYDKTAEPEIWKRAFVCTAESGADAGKFKFGVTPRGDGTGQVWLKSNTAVTHDQWTHVAFVSDATNMSIYINGSLDAVTSAPSQIHQSNRPIHIGAWNTKEEGYPPYDSFFNGTIDEVKIYNRALSADEIQADYEDGLAYMKGDFNNNEKSADAGDLAMMEDAKENVFTPDATYDLDGDGNPADEDDLTLLKNASVGKVVLE